MAASVLVTYRRNISGRLHQIRFACGPDNARLILLEAWNADSSIVSVQDDAA